jgi:hypothetical protein
MSISLTQNSGLLAYLAICVIAAAVLGVIAVSMAREGLSLKPILFIAVFMGIILLPGVVFFALEAIWPEEKVEFSALPAARLDETAVTGQTSFDYPQRLFGKDADLSLIRDARQIYGEAFTRAEVAQVAFWPTGEMVAVARYRNAAEAKRGGEVLRQMFRIAEVPGAPAGAAYWGSRPNAMSAEGDALLAQTLGHAVFFWAANSRQAVMARRAQSDFETRTTAPTTPPLEHEVPALVRLYRQTAFQALLIFLLVIAASLWFFKGSVWAARIEPAAAVAIPASELETRLLALTRNGRLEAVLPYETMQEKGTRSVRFALEPTTKLVRIYELDESAGQFAGEGRRTRAGITFYQKTAGQKQDPLTPYREVVSQAGWAWQPNVWNLPDWLQGILG